jgi:hypothetical protein
MACTPAFRTGRSVAENRFALKPCRNLADPPCREMLQRGRSIAAAETLQREPPVRRAARLARVCVVSCEPMAPLRPEDLTLSALPRSPLGHLKTEAVGELLQRAAWDYRETLGQNQRLSKSVEELTGRVEELMAQVASLEEAAARRKDRDELARTLLASAQRVAREERESARREAELILKKAARRADELEENVARREAELTSEITRLEALRDEILARLRRMLETLASRHGETTGSHMKPDEVVVAGRKR